MALVHVVSIGIKDADGDSKRVPLYVPATLTLTDIQAFANGAMTVLDAAIEGAITDALVTLALTMPGGLRAAPLAGSEAQKGALLTFDAANTNYNHSIFVPTWAEAGFAGNDVVNSGVYNAVIAGIVSGLGAGNTQSTDRYANDLSAYLKGEKRFRK